MKVAVLYHSVTGTTKKMAEVIVDGINSVAGVEGKAFSILEMDEEYIKESRCVILGTPVYYANMTGEMKIWFEKRGRKLPLAGKIAGAFATANYAHGGGELAIQTLLDHMMVLGMLAYSGGGACGRPVIHLGPLAVTEHADQYTELFQTYGQRMAMKTLELFPA
ncbi:flavodoxin family protein [Porphyromonadaceae bacterium OttesenSCG-928-L07]|nr:flavodoxin family protein [Porphyromonadaceae bacterium OttesenSCG-928-L07]MDL2251552.1 flavodoxin family protein [Odoribacter sp. OttesenSCG-928-J03]MDL2331077.1 flavodoxin family protein [Odoribacter sp. OttesenSCG-928-A06]